MKVQDLKNCVKFKKCLLNFNNLKFNTIYNCNCKMPRTKQEITKNVEFRVRVESGLKNSYVNFCRKNKFILSKRIRELVINDLERINEKI